MAKSAEKMNDHRPMTLNHLRVQALPSLLSILEIHSIRADAAAAAVVTHFAHSQSLSFIQSPE